ncbi:MAG: MarC family protein [Candidatus Norongarragalinales archaeon]
MLFAFSASEFITAATTLFIVMNPLSSIPVYLTLTQKLDAAAKRATVNQAALVAGGLAVVFLLAGPSFLEFTGLSLAGFKVAGGIVLGILGLQTVLGIHFGSKQEQNDPNAIGLIIGTPMLTGPGVLTTVLLTSGESGGLTAFAAIIFAVAASWLILRFADCLDKALGKRFIAVFAKVMGLVIIGKGVQLIVFGLKAIA